MRIKPLAIIGALLFALTAWAGSVADTDGDQVPDLFDICPNTPNGPGDGSNQIDADDDGFGNACDCDYGFPAPGDGIVAGNDLLELFGLFNQADTVPPVHDNTGDGFILGDDVLYCFAHFNSVVGDG